VARHRKGKAARAGILIGIAATLPRPTGGPVILRTLADYQCYTLTAVCSDCQRYTLLDHAVLAARFGWGALIPDIKRRVRCDACGKRTGGLIVGTKWR
jgi:hypothetical protein